MKTPLFGYEFKRSMYTHPTTLSFNPGHGSFFFHHKGQWCFSDATVTLEYPLAALNC